MGNFDCICHISKVLLFIGDTITWVKVGKLIQWGMFYTFQVWVKQHPKEMFFVSFLLFRECRKESLLMKRTLRDSGSRTNVQFAVVPWHTFVQVLHDTLSCLWYLLALAVKGETEEWCSFCLVAQSFEECLPGVTTTSEFIFGELDATFPA